MKTRLILFLILAPLLNARTEDKPEPGELVNADFSEHEGEGIPAGWRFTKTPWIDTRTSKEAIPEEVTVSTLTEGSKSLVRIAYRDNRDGCLVQTVEIPPKAKEARFKVSVRGKPDVEGGRLIMPDGGFRFFNAAGKFLPVPSSTKPPQDLSAKSWNDIEFTCQIPPGATFCNVIIGNLNSTSGIFEFRGVSVKFR